MTTTLMTTPHRLPDLQDLRDLAAELELSPGASFADVACGMGGPALWIAQETGANVRGIDLSAVAVSQAQRRASALGLGSVATFSVGTFDDTGLDTGSMDAAMTVDALQYAPKSRPQSKSSLVFCVRVGGSYSPPSSSTRLGQRDCRHRRGSSGRLPAATRETGL